MMCTYTFSQIQTIGGGGDWNETKLLGIMILKNYNQKQPPEYLPSQRGRPDGVCKWAVFPGGRLWVHKAHPKCEEGPPCRGRSEADQREVWRTATLWLRLAPLIFLTFYSLAFVKGFLRHYFVQFSEELQLCRSSRGKWSLSKVKSCSPSHP